MESERREALIKRRKVLKSRIAMNQGLAFLLDVTNCLGAHGAAYQSLWGEEDPSTAWIEARFPIASYGRVDWQRVPTSVCHCGGTYEEQCELVNHALEKYAVCVNTKITIAWSADKPAIRLKVVDAYACLGEILAVCFDTWIYSAEDNWLIEVYHEGEVCSGYKT